MEKLVYLLWPSETLESSNSSSTKKSDNAFRDQLLSALPGRLRSLGAENLKISVTDADVASGETLHLGAQQPKALVSFWLECIRERAGLELLLDATSSRKAGYLVAESQPLRWRPTEEERAATDEGHRSPGFSLVGCIEPGDGVSQKQFVETWESTHAQVAIDVQSTFSYVRNEVVRPVTEEAPPWRGIVEEGFPQEALTNPQAFYDAVGNVELHRRNLKKMVESCAAFLALERVDSHPMSEYRFF